MEKKPKGEISRLNSTLTEEQKLAKARILRNSITLLKGKAGSAKTYLACNVALDLLAKTKETGIRRIFISRPFVYGKGEEDLGILPGGVREKLIGITTPILENMYLIAGKEYIEKKIEEGIIVILPSVFMKGMTIPDSVIILDEYQNATIASTYTALTRLGKGSKMIITGDITQCDLRDKKDSGFDFLKKLHLEKLTGYEIIELTSNHRHDVVDTITSIYLQYKD